MNKKGGTTLEFIMWVITGIATALVYAHSTFISYREVAPRLERIESKLDSYLDRADGR